MRAQETIRAKEEQIVALDKLKQQLQVKLQQVGLLV